MVSFGNYDYYKVYKPSSAKNISNSTDVAIKKVQNVFTKPILAKRALREIKLLLHFNGHENV